MSCRFLSVIGLCCGLITTSVGAAPSPNYAVRLTADFHVQLQVSDSVLPDMFPGQCVVSGLVVRVFRDRTDTLEEGDKIKFVTLCTVMTPDFESTVISDADELTEARYLELFLNPGLETDYDLAGHQYMVIKGATENPLCETDSAGIKC